MISMSCPRARAASTIRRWRHQDLAQTRRTPLDASARVPHRALVDGAGFASDFGRFAPLHRMQLEAKPERAGAAEALNAVGMKRAGAGAGVDLGLDGVNPEIRQGHPFAPADLDLLFLGEAGFHTRRRERQVDMSIAHVSQRQMIGLASVAGRAQL